MANRAALSFSAFLLVGFSAAITQAQADGTDCTVYATDYANARMGSGDVVGDAVSGGMAGAVVGGEWRGALIVAPVQVQRLASWTIWAQCPAVGRLFTTWPTRCASSRRPG